MASETDERLMHRALACAARGLYTTDPNPRVGCVLAIDGELISEGFHEFAGGPHAEIVALTAAGDRAAGSTAYVTLEPCAHTGRTGPCADALITAGVSRVVFACRDPFDQVNGRGIARLRAAGIEVTEGVCRDQARELNPGFFKRHESGLPWVRLKLAGSLDGATAMNNGDSKWITGAEARSDVQQYRARASAILTGMGTIRADDPDLNVRLDDARQQPAVVIIDPDLSIDPGARVLSHQRQCILATASRTAIPDWAGSMTLMRDIDAAADGRNLDLHELMKRLADLEFNEIHVEAGARLSGQLIRLGLVDEVVLYQAAVVMGNQTRPLFDTPGLDEFDQRIHLEYHAITQLGPDLKLVLRPVAG